MADKTIGIVTNDREAPFQSGVIEGVLHTFQTAGAEAIIASHPENPYRESAISLNWRGLDGVLVISAGAPESWLHKVHSAGKPISLVSHTIPDLPLPAVYSDNRQGVAEAMRYLVVDCKRTQPVFIRGIMTQIDGRQRESAFREALIRHQLHIPETYFLNGEFNVETAAAELRRFLADDPPFDAVIAADYQMGVAALNVLRAAGKHIPKDVSIVGFGDAPEAEAAGLTTIAAEIRELGARAARQLLAQVNGAAISGVTQLRTRLIIRGT
jgi:DNA-binding LacI/PurR family transcriptional regulator